MWQNAAQFLQKARNPDDERRWHRSCCLLGSLADTSEQLSRQEGPFGAG